MSNLNNEENLLEYEFEPNTEITTSNNEAIVYIANKIDSVFFDYITSTKSDIDYYIVINNTNEVKSDSKNIIFYNRPYDSDKSDSSTWMYGLSKIKNKRYKKISFCKRNGEESGVLYWSC